MNLRHGHARKNGTRTYHTWSGMLSRCSNPNDSKYRVYGGAGIAVCGRWRVFENFLADMGERPAGTSLDRIDGTRGYEPANCRWATAEEQNQNRRTVRLVTIGDVTKPAFMWARQAGLTSQGFRSRLLAGKTGSDLVDTEKHNHRLTADLVRDIRRRAAAGEKQVAIARELGVSKMAISDVVRRVRWAHVTDEASP